MNPSPCNLKPIIEALIAVADQPVYEKPRARIAAASQCVHCICFRQIEQRDHDDRTDLDNVFAASAIARSDFLNSSAMITVKIALS